MSIVKIIVNKNFTVRRNKQNRSMLVSNCTVSGKKARGSRIKKLVK